MLRKIFVKLILLLSLSTQAQIPVEWHPATNSHVINGEFLAGTVQVIQEGVGNDLSFSSPYPSPLLLGGNIHHFTTIHTQPESPPSKKITFNFSMPVVISRLNIGDINMSNTHNDALHIRGVRFTSVTSTGGVDTTLNSASPIRNGTGNVIWHLSTTAITSFSIEYATTNFKTHSFITYALEVMLPGNPGGGSGGGILVEICPDASTELAANTPIGSNFSYIWSTPSGVTNPGNARSITTTQTGSYSVLATDLDTGLQLQIKTWSVRHLPLENLSFRDLPTSVCPDKITLNQPLPTMSIQNIPGRWTRTRVTANNATFTFTPDPGLCGKPFTLTVPVVGVTPNFDLHSEVCHKDEVALPKTSLNNISGTWTEVSDNGIILTYNFTPAPNQCAFETQMTIPIKTKTNPYFSIATPECSTSNFDFPLISNNAITGQWKLLSSNTTKNIYEFTPDDLRCYDPITIEILNLQIPEFTIIPSVCDLSEIALPTRSDNDFEGSWTLVAQSASAIEYLFTPIDFCVATYTAVISIQKKTIPIFEQINVNCKFNEEELPGTSINGINGSWKLSDEDGNRLTYTFTPTAGQCAHYTTMEIVNSSLLTLNFDPQCIENDFYLKVKLTDGNTAIPISKYEYYYNDQLVSSTDKLNITALQIKEGNLPAKFVVNVIQENGCEVSNEINIFNLECFIPRGLSPNNDQINDRLDLKNFHVRKLSIFNRFGKLVYEKANYKNEWWGQNNSGNLLPTGTYFYQINFINDTSPRTGWIYLNTPK